MPLTRDRLVINLPAGWLDKSEPDPLGPAVYITRRSKFPGYLVVAVASRRKPPSTEVSDETLIKLAMELAKPGKEKVLSQTHGNTPWGRFGCVVSATIAFRTHAWAINKGTDTILVTHIGQNPPNKAEMSDVEKIVEGLSLAEAQVE